MSWGTLTMTLMMRPWCLPPAWKWEPKTFSEIWSIVLNNLLIWIIHPEKWSVLYCAGSSGRIAAVLKLILYSGGFVNSSFTFFFLFQIYGSEGLKLVSHEETVSFGQAVLKLTFDPGSPDQSLLTAECRLDHPFFVKNKGKNLIYRSVLWLFCIPWCNKTFIIKT